MEVLIATGLSAVAMTAIFSAFLFFCKTGLQMEDYHDMERQARLALLQFGQDARQAQNAVWSDADTVTLTVSAGDVTYSYDDDSGIFLRTLGGNQRTLASGVRDFEFRAYALNGDELPVWSQFASIGDETKMIQVEFALERTGTLRPDASFNIISARYVLRNKPTS